MMNESSILTFHDHRIIQTVKQEGTIEVGMLYELLNHLNMDKPVL